MRNRILFAAFAGLVACQSMADDQTERMRRAEVLYSPG